MSWAIFKNNIISKSVDTMDDIDVVANLWAKEYDAAVKRGNDSVNFVNVQTGNVPLMEKFFKVALQIGLTQNTPTYSLVTQMGQGVLAYWSNAILNPLKIPLIPAPGSVSNVSVILNQCYIPGVWAPQRPIKPTDNVEIIVNQFISAATKHLTTIGGTIQTISMYPGVPPFAAPGIIAWSGYTVPPAGPGISAAASAKLSIPANFTLTEAEVEVYTQKLNTSKSQLENTNEPTAVSTVSEYIKKLEDEIENGKVSADTELTKEDILALELDSPPPLQSILGRRIVEEANKDIGITETNFKNYGGTNSNYPNTIPYRNYSTGRIDVMHNKLNGNNWNVDTGLYGDDKVGWPWCAAAVSAWWRQAGCFPLKSLNGGNSFNGSAGCDVWMNWAKSNGRWSGLPVIGAAVLYGSSRDATHIGIVAAITEDGKVTTIEGNTSKAGFERNGGGCYSKLAATNRIVGYVIPPDVEPTPSEPQYEYDDDGFRIIKDVD